MSEPPGMHSGTNAYAAILRKFTTPTLIVNGQTCSIMICAVTDVNENIFDVHIFDIEFNTKSEEPCMLIEGRDMRTWQSPI